MLTKKICQWMKKQDYWGRLPASNTSSCIQLGSVASGQCAHLFIKWRGDICQCVRYQIYGSAVTMAVFSYVADFAEGKTVSDIEPFLNVDAWRQYFSLENHYADQVAFCHLVWRDALLHQPKIHAV